MTSSWCLDFFFFFGEGGTLQDPRMRNMSGRPCVSSSSVYSSSRMQLKSLSRAWISGRRCCAKLVRSDSSHVCSVHATPERSSHKRTVIHPRAKRRRLGRPCCHRLMMLASERERGSSRSGFFFPSFLIFNRTTQFLLTKMNFGRN